MSQTKANKKPKVEVYADEEQPVVKNAGARMEFFATYGWALLIILVAIGALAYFGVLPIGKEYSSLQEFCNKHCKESGLKLEFDGCITEGDAVHVACKKAGTFCQEIPALGGLTRCVNFVDYKNDTFSRLEILK